MESFENAHTITVKSSECVSTLMERIREQLSKQLLYVLCNRLGYILKAFIMDITKNF